MKHACMWLGWLALALPMVAGASVYRSWHAAAVTHWHCGSRLLPPDRAPGSEGPARAGSCDEPDKPTVTVFSRGALDPQATDALSRSARALLLRSGVRPLRVRVQYMRVTP